MRPERRREGTDMKTTFPAALAALSIAATPGAARDSHDLDPIIVSGGLTPIEAARYGRAATVITAQEIEERGILSVQDALRAVPGLSVNSAGANFTQVRIRGGEGNHTLILIDGVEAACGDSERADRFSCDIDYPDGRDDDAHHECVDVPKRPAECQLLPYGWF